MYIADVPAGSAQDDLRDLNRAGYRSERPWNDAPDPVFEEKPPVKPPKKRPAARRQPQRPRTFLDRLAAQARRERRDVAVCAALVVVMMMMTAAWGQKMIRGVEIQQTIRMYQANTVAFERDNERLAQELERARDGKRIRNLAQNELGMLRPERARTETIYIQTPENVAEEPVQNIEEPGVGMLDILLGLLNVFQIGE